MRYRLTPERIEALNAALRIADATAPKRQPAVPPIRYMLMEMQFAEEDEIERQFGRCDPARWTVTDADGRTLTVGPCKTTYEAEARATEIWQVAGSVHRKPLRFSRLNPTPKKEGPGQCSIAKSAANKP